MCPTLTVGSFLDTYGPLFCSLFICSLRKFKTPETSEPGQNKKGCPETRKHTKDPLSSQIPPNFFRHYATFLKNMLNCIKGSPFICFDILQHNGCQKIPKGPFKFFGNVRPLNVILNFFLEIFLNSPKGPPSFFSYCATNWSFKKPKGSPLLQF